MTRAEAPLEELLSGALVVHGSTILQILEHAFVQPSRSIKFTGQAIRHHPTLPYRQALQRGRYTKLGDKPLRRFYNYVSGLRAPRSGSIGTMSEHEGRSALQTRGTSRVENFDRLFLRCFTTSCVTTSCSSAFISFSHFHGGNVVRIFRNCCTRIATG